MVFGFETAGLADGKALKEGTILGYRSTSTAVDGDRHTKHMQRYPDDGFGRENTNLHYADTLTEY